MAHRFRFIGEQQPDATWRLSGDEAHHLVKVLRLPEGSEIEVTDGRGSWAEGTVSSAREREVVIATSTVRSEAASVAPFVFAIGALKPGAVDDILPALTELGVDEMWIFQLRESAKARLQDKVIERWRRVIAQSVKQCKRNWMPALRTFDSVEEMILAVKTRGDTVRVVLGADATDTLLSRLSSTRGKPLIVVAGGEKGFASEEERALRDAEFQTLSLGPHVLRAVTAAVAAAAVVASVRL